MLLLPSILHLLEQCITSSKFKSNLDGILAQISTSKSSRWTNKQWFPTRNAKPHKITIRVFILATSIRATSASRRQHHKISLNSAKKFFWSIYKTQLNWDAGNAKLIRHRLLGVECICSNIFDWDNGKQFACSTRRREQLSSFRLKNRNIAFSRLVSGAHSLAESASNEKRF